MNETKLSSSAAQLVVLSVLALTLVFPVTPARAQDNVNTTPVVIPELPVEIETELSPAGSLKQAPLWKEIVQLLEDPYAIDCPDPLQPTKCTAEIERRPGFGVTMPPLNVYPVDFNVLTGQPLRLRTSDGAISWDQPGPLFDPGEVVPVGPGNVPTALRTVIGELVVVFEPAADCPTPAGCLAVRNPELGDLAGVPDSRIPPDGTIVAKPAFFDGVLHEIDPATGDREEVVELETPINEIDFLRPTEDTGGIPAPRRPFIGRAGAEVLGKGLFWDMQVGSDGVQACGSCHFHAGVDNRTKDQLNPATLAADLTLQVKQPGQDVVASDFPFHRLTNPDIPGEPNLNSGNVASDANDVMSSMGVSRFKLFVDIPPIGPVSSFGPAFGGVSPLLPDVGTVVPDPVPVMQDRRRVEPRHTPTMHSAAFNFDNFWDGRARFHFNGGSVFGPSDPQFHAFIDPGTPGPAGGGLQGTTNGHVRTDLVGENPLMAAQPIRIKFSSLASQAVGPPLSNFEMSFDGRNWAKIGKKLLQIGVVPLANQLVATDDSELGAFSNQGGASCTGGTAAGKPGLCISYNELIELAFKREYWQSNGQRLNGAPAVCTGTDANGFPTPAGCDPFDGYALTAATGAAAPTNTNQFRQREANFSLFFGLAVQIWEQLLIPDDTPFDQFLDANPLAGNGVAQPGEQGTLPPETIRELVTGSETGNLTLVPGFGQEELFGFDIFAGANLTAALPVAMLRNGAGMGSNPFLRTGRCMLCHLGPEQTDHTISVNHGLLLSGTEFEFPTPPTAPEPTGPFALVTGLSLAEELEEPAQDGVEIENRNFAIVDDPATTDFDEAVIGEPSAVAFQDNGIYNIGVRPTDEDIGRGGPDPFGRPLALAALALKNLGGPNYRPCDDSSDAVTHPTGCALPNFDPVDGFGGGLFEEVGEGFPFPGTALELESINPGLEMEPATPLMPAYMWPWLNNLPAGELHPQIDELAFAPNTITEPPAAEFAEVLFGADLHCGVFDPTVDPTVPPSFGWGPRCPNSQSAIPNNFDPPLNGTWPIPNRIEANGAIKAPQLRNVELTGPYFHTGSYLTLRQVVDFYMRGGDFPITNAESRDPNLVDIEEQAFGFGTTIGLPAQFQDAVPDAVSQYGVMPDTGHATTPEPASSTPDQAKVALVKFLLALTDERVRFERAPFDRPEIFVPIDGTAPDNTGGRAGLVALTTGDCGGVVGAGPCFLQLGAMGAGGRPDALGNFLGISSTEGAGCDHFDRDCGAPAVTVAPEPVLTGFQVAIALDPTLTQGVQLGQRFVARREFRTTRQRGNTLIVEAKAQLNGAAVSATFTPADPAVVQVSPRVGPKAKITVRQCDAQTSVNVTSSQGSKQLQIITTCEGNTIQGELTQ